MKEKLTIGLCFLLAFLLLPLLAFTGPSRPAVLPEDQAESASPSSLAGTASSSSASENTGAGEEAGEDSFRILDTGSGQVLEIGRMDFLRGAAAAEMPMSFETEALAAQMAASYTYYGRLRQKARQSPDPDLKGADFSADVQNWEKYTTPEQMKERWGDNFDEYYAKLTEAAEKAAGYALTYDGEWIDATYYAISAGVTENSRDIWGGNLPYLTAVASPGDTLAAGYRTKAEFSSEELKEALLSSFSELSFSDSPASWIGETVRSDSGSVLTISVCGTELPGGKFRSALGLRSQNFTVSFQEDSFVFTVLGYGHGVGMSQTGAQYMAKQGATFQEILYWYYPGAQLTAVDEKKA